MRLVRQCPVRPRFAAPAGPHRLVLSAFATSTHQRSDRSETSGTFAGAGAETSQVSQVWPNSPACRTRWLPSAQSAGLGRGRLAVRRPAVGAAPLGLTAVGDDGPGEGSVDRAGEHPRPGSGARRPWSTSSRSRARRPCPTPARSTSSPLPYDVSESGLPPRASLDGRGGDQLAELDPRQLHRRRCSGWRSAWARGGGAAFSSSVQPVDTAGAGSRPGRCPRGNRTGARRQGDEPTIAACATP